MNPGKLLLPLVILAVSGCDGRHDKEDATRREINASLGLISSVVAADERAVFEMADSGRAETEVTQKIHPLIDQLISARRLSNDVGWFKDGDLWRSPYKVTLIRLNEKSLRYTVVSGGRDSQFDTADDLFDAERWRP